GAPIAAFRGHPVERREVATVAALVDLVAGVPEDLAAGVGVVLADVGKGTAGDVLRALPRRLVDRLLVRIERQVLTVPLAGLLVAVVPLELRVGEVDDRIRVLPLLVV